MPYLSEMEGPRGDSPGEASGYRPEPEDKEAIELVEKLYSRAKKYRKRYDQKWIDYYKMFRGRQWKEVKPSYRHSEVINVIFQTIESMVPILTDSRPKLEFVPTVASQFELSDILNKVAENDWIRNNWLMVLTEILFDAHFYGAGFGYCGFDEKADMGLGNVCFESVDPIHIFPDPDARDINEKRCKFVVHAEPMAISVVKKKYPDIAKYLTSDVIDLAQGDKADIYQVMFKSPVDSKLIVEGPSGYDTVQKDQVVLLTCYFKDDDYEELCKEELDDKGEPVLDEDGKPKEVYEQKLKYPNGRKIVVASGVLCENVELEFEDGKIPYVKLLNYILPREFWGMGEVEQLEGPQKTLNNIISYALDVMSLMGNPVWKVGTAANIDTDNLFNKPGLIIEGDDISQIQREEGVNLQPFILELVDKYRQMMDGISGQADVSRGATPGDVTAGTAIESLQQAQQTRLRLKSRNIDAFLQEFGKMYISRVFQYYSVPRIVRVSGDDNAEEFFHFHVEKLDGGTAQDGSPIPPKMVAHVTTFEAGIPTTVQHEITADFDVRVSTGSALPFAKETKTNLSMNLFKLGVIDDEELLKNIDYPNFESVLQRVGQKKAAAAQQQQEMQAQQIQQVAQAKAQASMPRQ